MSITQLDTLRFGSLNGNWFIYKTGVEPNGDGTADEYIYIAHTSAQPDKWGAVTELLRTKYAAVYVDGGDHDSYITAGFTPIFAPPPELQHFGAKWYVK